MESFIIEGGHQLQGTITPQGAKNEALEVIAAVLLTSDPVRIANIPDILDVNNLIRLLQDMGVKVTRNGKGDFTFQADELNLDFLASDEYVCKCSALRGSVLMMGPLLGRFGKAVVAEPGGDKIGRRRLDTHFLGFKNLGAAFNADDERHVYNIEAEKLHGTYVNGKRNGYFTLQLRDGGVAVVAYKNGKSAYDYFMVTMPDGTQQKRALNEIKTLLQ